MLKLSSKKKHACLALAVAASILGGGTVFEAESAIYSISFTVAKWFDVAYEDLIVGTVVFNFPR